MELDYGLLNLAVTLALLAATFLFRKRLLSALGRLLLHGSIEFARATFLEEGTDTLPGGEKRAYVRLRPAGEALVAAVVPSLLAVAVKSIKIKPGAAGASPLPEGLDLSNLASSLPALLGSGLIPKKYAGLLAIAAPFLQGFLGGQAKPEEGKPGVNPFLKELHP